MTPSGALEWHWVTQGAPKWSLFRGKCWWMLVNVGRGERFAAGVGSAEGGEASPPSFERNFINNLARPATSERGAADLKASPLPPAPLAAGNC